MLRQTIF